jgi:hypothetical protein
LENPLLTPLVASLIFLTAKSLGLDIEEDRERLIAALERDDLFAREFCTPPAADEIEDRAARWEQRYTRLDPALRSRVVQEAVKRLRGSGPGA